MEVNEKVDKIMSQIKPDNKYSKKWAAQREGQRGKANPYRPNQPPTPIRSPATKPSGLGGERGPRPGYVYGASASAKKIRRCGECEGCMREDCGKCEICLDKPRFGGPGKLKKACPDRKCEIMALKKR